MYIYGNIGIVAHIPLGVRVTENDHLHLMMKDFFHDGSGVFHDDNALLHRAQQALNRLNNWRILWITIHSNIYGRFLTGLLELPLPPSSEQQIRDIRDVRMVSYGCQEATNQYYFVNLFTFDCIFHYCIN